ncbi:hypothetical protein R1538_05460 [Rhizobium leguminosarum]|uniref:hypothetical protein n=1 Tax=Rhizobium leguminosarum TaxID=384 RepID=UPI00293DB73D|nr:hypothetical protein [Rhizobium leguminosarum]MDV4160567.1 hypothetical protein [Rhizobium leguminosarum]MDV4170296.1 hypothetical protein [Rhizobium leguminosarum]
MVTDTIDIVRPVMPRNLNTVTSKDAIALVATFRPWFETPAVIAKISAGAVRTREFLEANNCTSTPLGAIGDPDPWLHIEDVETSELLETDDEEWLALRLSSLRMATFCEGACRLIGVLDESGALPWYAYTYNDQSTNLAEYAFHQRLMRSYFKCMKLGKDPKTDSSGMLDDLLPLLLYRPHAQRGPARAKIVQMVSVGLWDADPPGAGARDWKIRAGPVARALHFDAFVPTVKRFQPLLRGSSRPGDR